MTKDEIRSVMRAKRRALSAETAAKNSAEISKRLFALPEFRRSETVMVYMSAFKEPSTDAILDRVLSEKRAVVPVCDTEKHTIIPSYINSKNDLASGAYGIREPKNIMKADIDDIDLALVPGLAFDLHGARIGFGEGYYDRFLSEFRGVKLGICHDFQLLSEIPSLDHDSAMDIIITEKRTADDF